EPAGAASGTGVGAGGRVNARALFAATALAVAVSSCGSPSLHARYDAERAAWLARRDVERIRINPRLAAPSDYARAVASYRRIVERHPAATWRTWGSAESRDGLEVTGRAALAIAQLEEMRGDQNAALACW